MESISLQQLRVVEDWSPLLILASDSWGICGEDKKTEKLLNRIKMFQ